MEGDGDGGCSGRRSGERKRQSLWRPGWPLEKKQSIQKSSEITGKPCRG